MEQGQRPRKQDKPGEPRGNGNGGSWGLHEHPEDPSVGLTLEPDIDSAEDTDPEWQFQPVLTYTFPDTNLGVAIASINRANARLAKAGIDERFTYETEEDVRNVDGQLFAVTTLTLNKPSIAFDGWSFTGAHDFTPDGAVISHVNAHDVPPVLDTRCDHCNTTRRRERVYTLRHAGQGDVQVGKSCLAAFLGIRPEGLWALEFGLEEIAGSEDPDELADRFRTGTQLYPAADLIAATLAASNGGTEFLSKNSAGFDQTPTANVVLRDWDKFTAPQLAEHRELAAEIRAWVDSIPEDTTNDYLLNLRSALSGPADKFVKKQHVAIAASAVSAYRKAQEREVEKAQKEKFKQSFAPGFIGEEKERVRGRGATILRANSFESTYGYTTAIAMITDDGHQVTWFASGIHNLEAGRKVVFDATVKAHGQYDGADQTMITRAKLTDPETGDPVG